jgi:hypothetical protein
MQKRTSGPDAVERWDAVGARAAYRGFTQRRIVCRRWSCTPTCRLSRRSSRTAAPRLRRSHCRSCTHRPACDSSSPGHKTENRKACSTRRDRSQRLCGSSRARTGSLLRRPRPTRSGTRLRCGYTPCRPHSRCPSGTGRDRVANTLDNRHLRRALCPLRRWHSRRPSHLRRLRQSHLRRLRHSGPRLRPCLPHPTQGCRCGFRRRGQRRP